MIVCRVTSEVVCQHSPRRGPARHSDNTMLGVLEVGSEYVNAPVLAVNNLD